MTRPTAHARHLRGALVGLCSALLTVLAHTAAGGALPAGAPLMLLIIVSATTGAASGMLTLDGRAAAFTALIAALGTGQLLGHLTLSLAAHHGHGLGLTSGMLALHAIAAIGLGVLIALAEHLYLVCASVLCWLRLILVNRRRVPGSARWFAATSVVAQSILLVSGLGMRAPPRATLHLA